MAQPETNPEREEERDETKATPPTVVETADPVAMFGWSKASKEAHQFMEMMTELRYGTEALYAFANLLGITMLPGLNGPEKIQLVTIEPTPFGRMPKETIIKVMTHVHAAIDQTLKENSKLRNDLVSAHMDCTRALAKLAELQKEATGIDLTNADRQALHDMTDRLVTGKNGLPQYRAVALEDEPYVLYRPDGMYIGTVEKEIPKNLASLQLDTITRTAKFDRALRFLSKNEANTFRRRIVNNAEKLRLRWIHNFHIHRITLRQL